MQRAYHTSFVVEVHNEATVDELKQRIFELKRLPGTEYRMELNGMADISNDRSLVQQLKALMRFVRRGPVKGRRGQDAGRVQDPRHKRGVLAQ